MSDWLETNRANWDDRTHVHLTSAFYDVGGWLQRGEGPEPREAMLLGDVSGQHLVHLQCHFGMDTLAWARAGAFVTGVDFSHEAILAARELAERAGLADRSRFVESNVLAAAAVLEQRYDIVYISLGSLCWLPRIEEWAEAAVGLMAPHGRLLLHDVHPLAFSLDDDGASFAYPYFEEADAVLTEEARTYTDGGAIAHTASYQWNHSLGDIVTALASQGLRISALFEHDWTRYQAFPSLVRDADGRWHWPAGVIRLPLSFTLLGEAP